MTRSCETCAYYDQGLCRRSVPNVTWVTWPSVRANDWCGEYEVAEDPPRDAMRRLLTGCAAAHGFVFEGLRHEDDDAF